jgi:nucleotide-binding universal stress UspA family protein
VEKPLIVGVDGSDPSLAALDWAVDEAVARKLPLLVVHGSRWDEYVTPEPSFSPVRPSVQVIADHLVASAVERAASRSAEVKVTSTVVAEDPALALVRLAEEASAVVVGSRGHGELAELLLGSVSLAVAARSASPVIVVRGLQKPYEVAAIRTVAVGVGHPAEAAPAVDFAFREAELHGAAVTAVHAWRCPAQEVPDLPAATPDDHLRRAEGEVTEALRNAVSSRPGIAVRHEIAEGTARAALLDTSRTAGLLVVGARRRKGRVGMQLGPVNHAVLHHARCPVAVVPHD